MVRKNFSRYAGSYDRYSTIQDLAASRLISRINGKSFARILDIGCGTGNYTRLLREKFPVAHIKAIDISKSMVEIADKKLRGQNIEFIIRDGEELLLGERFDLISSNAAFQWFEDLPSALSGYRELLTEDGVISFSIFGPKTYCELEASLRELFSDDFSISSSAFMRPSELKSILSSIFRQVEIEEATYKERDDSLKGLLNKIRYTGTSGNNGNSNRFWTPKTISALDEIYRRRYKDIISTYQLFFCKGQR